MTDCLSKFTYKVYICTVILTKLNPNCDILTGAVERVKKIRDYAFVHFSQREDAIEAMNALNGKVNNLCCHDSIQVPFLYNVYTLNVQFWSNDNKPFNLQVIDGSPIEVTLAKPVDKDSYVRYTRGTGGRGATLLQSDYAYTLGQVYDPSAAYLGAPVFYAPHAYTALPSQFRFPTAKGHISTRGLVRPPSVRGKRLLSSTPKSACLSKLIPAHFFFNKIQINYWSNVLSVIVLNHVIWFYINYH